MSEISALSHVKYQNKVSDALPDPSSIDNFNANVKQEPKDEFLNKSACNNTTVSPLIQETKTNLKRKFPCPILGCLKSYGKSSHLRSHLTWHTGIKPFVCEIEECGKSFTRSDELARHMRTHTGEKPFECCQCFKKFSRSDHLSKHIATHKKHLLGNVKRRRPAKSKHQKKCSVSKITKVKTDEMPTIDGDNEPTRQIYDVIPLLEVTMKEEGEEEEAEEKLLIKKEMIADTIIATNFVKEEPIESYSPEINSMSQNRDIKEEIIFPDSDNSTISSLLLKSEKPFQCHFDSCSKTFTRSDDLTRHIRSHTGEKPYACEECSKRFVRSDHLKKHIQTHIRKLFQAH